MYRTGGFGGKGFKFDEAERDLDNERKKLQKISHGMGESDDEDDQIVSCCASFFILILHSFLDKQLICADFH